MRILSARRFALGAFVPMIAMFGSVPAKAASVEQAPPPNGTIAYVVTTVLPAVYQTSDAKAECPTGLNATHLEQYEAQFPTEEARKAQRRDYGYFHNRGRNGENVHYSPESVVDPLPFKEAVGKVSLGLNLDGKVGPNDFVSPDGEAGVDNELYRVLGCISGWRDNGTMTFQNEVRMRDNRFNRIIFVLSGVDNLENDNEVTIRTYRGLDNVPLDSLNKGVPGSTQRIDFKFGQRYMHVFKGKIVNGVLTTTAPADYVMPWSIIGDGRFAGDEQWYREARLQLKVDSRRAEGLLAGYVDVAGWWWAYTKRTSAHIGDAVRSSPPSVWVALKRRADAFPDPVTGQNTAISTAVALKFVRAEISNLPKEETQHLASAAK